MAVAESKERVDDEHDGAPAMVDVPDNPTVAKAVVLVAVCTTAMIVNVSEARLARLEDADHDRIGLKYNVGSHRATHNRRGARHPAGPASMAHERVLA